MRPVGQKNSLASGNQEEAAELADGGSGYAAKQKQRFFLCRRHLLQNWICAYTQKKDSLRPGKMPPILGCGKAKATPGSHA